MGRENSTNEGKEECFHGFGAKDRKKKTTKRPDTYTEG
jgi:hypothetical protein